MSETTKPMSKAHLIWMALWEHAALDPSPFEIDELVPAVQEATGFDAHESRYRVGFLLTELSRLPDGQQFFTREGDAVVVLDEFMQSPKDPATALDAYPFEV